MKRVVWGILAGVAVYALCCHVAQPRKAEIESKPFEFNTERMVLADSVINQSIADDDFPGAVLCVVKRADDGESMGEILYLKAYGNRQVCSARDTASGQFVSDTIPMTTDAIFDLASVSKCVGTTLSFMRVVEDGLVRLTDNVSRYIPGFKPWESTPEKKGDRIERRNITITNLLNHTSGLPSYVGVPGFLARFEQYGDPLKMNLRDSLTAYLTDGLPRLNRPGEVMRYSCLNFITLQTVIERTTGQRLDHFAKKEVFDKLRLKNTWYNCIADAERPYAADANIVPTEVQPDGKILCGEVHDPLARVINGGVSGNAGVFSTAEDLAVVASLMLNDGVIRLPAEGIKGVFGGTDRIRLYSKNTVDAFTRIPAGYEEHGRALGWDIGVGHGSYMGELLTPGSLVNHSGYTGTSIAINQKDGIAIIFLTNRVHPFDDGGVARARATVSNIVVSAMDHQ